MVQEITRKAKKEMKKKKPISSKQLFKEGEKRGFDMKNPDGIEAYLFAKTMENGGSLEWTAKLAPGARIWKGTMGSIE